MSTTVYEICEAIPELDEHGRFDIKAAKGRKERVNILGALKPKKAPTVEGLHTFTPAELLSLRIPTQEVNSRVTGYQRPFEREHARKQAVAMMSGKRFPPMTIALDGNGNFYAVDCQHRAVAGVISRTSLDGVVYRLTKDEQRQLFSDQRKAKPVNRNVIILAGSSPYEEYIQDAVTNDRHAWAKIVSANPGSKTRISPLAMLNLLYAYVGNTAATVPSATTLKNWDQKLADELAPLVACFGDKQSNPAAFKPSIVRAIGIAAMYVFRRNEHTQAGDYERWLHHMPLFPWERFLFVRSSADMTFHLVGHWNKRLHASRKARLD